MLVGRIGVRVEVPGNPIPLQRARAFKNVFYDPQFTVKKNYAAFVKDYIDEPITKEIELDLEFYFQMPKSWSKKKRDSMNNKPHIGKKDLDNLIKFVGDALNEVAWQDDCLIWKINAIKKWSETAKTVIDCKETI